MVPFLLLIVLLVLFSTSCLALSDSNMALRNAVLTGSNKGLGLELCRQLVGDYQIFALCRQSSPELDRLAAEHKDKLQILDNIDVMDENIGEKLQTTPLFKTQPPAQQQPVKIHLLIHNAGAYGPPETFDGVNGMYESQTLENVTAHRLEYSFKLNAVAPLVVTQALLSNMAQQQEPNSNSNCHSKIIIISSLMGSITDNGSGGHYGYRMAKAAVNMMGKSLAVDLKERGVAVGLVHPGFVYTNFGGAGSERRPGQRNVDESVRGVIQAVEQVNLENTGCFLHGNYGEGVQPLRW